MNLTKREATALADALIVWRRRASPLLTPAEIDDLIERLTAGAARPKRWEYCRFHQAIDNSGLLTRLGDEGWEIAAATNDIVYLRREIIE